MRRSCSSRSSPVNGSSRSSTRGDGASERASATRFASPPLSSLTRRRSKPARPTRSSISATRRWRTVVVVAPHPQTEGDVAGDVEVLEQLLVLEHHADVAPVCRHRRGVGTIDAHRAAIGTEQAGDHAQQRRLAAARGTEQADDLTSGDGDRRPCEDDVAVERDVDIDHRQRGAHRPGATDCARSRSNTTAIVAAARMTASAYPCPWSSVPVRPSSCSIAIGIVS